MNDNKFYEGGYVNMARLLILTSFTFVMLWHSYYTNIKTIDNFTVSAVYYQSMFH